MSSTATDGPSAASPAHVGDPSPATEEGPAGEPAAGDGDAVTKPRRYRGRMPEERRAQRRRKLLDTGLELFAVEGYAKTSVEGICSTAGVTGRHFYEEFPGREALLVGVFDEIIDESYSRVVRAVADSPHDLTARLVAGVSAYMHYLLDDPRHARIVTVESVGISAEFETHRRESGAAFATFIQGEALTLIAEGSSVHGNELTVLALVAAIHELTASWLAHGQPMTIDALIAEGVRIIRAVALAPA